MPTFFSELFCPFSEPKTFSPTPYPFFCLLFCEPPLVFCVLISAGSSATPASQIICKDTKFP